VADEERRVVCGNPNCGRDLQGTSAGDACPACGARVRKTLLTLAAEVSMRATVHYDGFPSGRTSKRSRFAWGMTGWDWSLALSRFVRKVSHFDKRGDRRKELVVDEQTGTVLHEQDHPLTEHRGHGSDTERGK
jgi:hypothetical protein